MTHDPQAYGRRMADVYDRFYADLLDTEGAVERLAALAGDGPVLELGVGTGRLAIPLAARGLEVHGVDASPEMLDALAARPGGEAVVAVRAGFTEIDLGARFSLVVAAFNVMFALGSQDEQVEVFRRAAAHLRPGGALVVEAFVLDPSRLQAAPVVVPRMWSRERLELQVLRHDPSTQRIDSMLVMFDEEGGRLSPATHQYAWPTEFDLMARLAGLRLRTRWADWRGSPFTAVSQGHVSVYAAEPAA
ncbi:MAG TPA: class I SAM-dependent methyltransferase [Miltoncostaeaceae bacterium]|nr:class I SAM-dependent methyltransferase [Miltoncostaeaceae bacterium]